MPPCASPAYIGFVEVQPQSRTLADDVLDAPKAMIRMGLPPVRIEVMKTFSGVEFDDCWPRRVDLAIDNLTISMISLQDLETNKLASGRPKNHDFDNAFF